MPSPFEPEQDPSTQLPVDSGLDDTVPLEPAALAAPGQLPEPEETGPEEPEPLTRRFSGPSLLPDIVQILLRGFVIGASLALAIGAMTLNRAALVASNALEKGPRSRLLLAMAAAGVFVALVPSVYMLVKRRALAVQKSLRALRLIAPLGLAAPLPFFFDWRVFNGRELWLVASATAYGLLAEKVLRGSLEALREYNWRDFSVLLAERFPRLYRRTPPLLAAALALFLAGYFSYFTVLHHYRIQTASYDLASYNNIMWNLLHGHWFKSSPVLGPEGSHIHHHATFGAFFFLPFYALRPNADTMLVLQAVLVGAAVIPLYLLASRRLQSSWQALILCYAYAIHAPLHGPVFYDFHFLTTAPFWIGWVLYCFDAGKRGWLVVTWLAALLLREDQGACMAAASLFFLLSRQRPRWAFFGGLLSAVYFGLVKFVVMPLHPAGNLPTDFAWMYNGLIPKGEGGFGGVLRTVFTNPVMVFGGLLDAGKVAYVLKTFGPVLFLPLRMARTWLFFIPAATFTLLSTGYTPLYESYFQYTSNWTAYLFFATAVVVASLREREGGWARGYSALLAVGFVATIFSYNQGAIFQHNNFRGGFRQVVFEWKDGDADRLRELNELIAMIPADASVAATETEAPHVSSRENCFTMRKGYLDAEYLLINTLETRGGASGTYMQQARASKQYKRIAKRGVYQLWKRKSAGEPDDEADTGDE